MTHEYDSEDFAASVRVHHAAWERGRLLRELWAREREEREAEERVREQALAEAGRLYDRVRYADNPEPKRRRRMEYYREHHEEQKAAMRAYHWRNRERLKAKARARRAAKKHKQTTS